MADVFGDANAQFQVIRNAIRNLNIATSPLPFSRQAYDLQQILQSLESNSDPNNPGLTQIFRQSNNNITGITATINSTAVPSVSLLQSLTTELYTAWAAFQANAYLLWNSAYLGYPAPAAQFFAPVVPQLNKPILPNPIIIVPPAPPVSTPPVGLPAPPQPSPTVPTTGPSIPSVPLPTPGVPTSPTTPAPPPTPGVPTLPSPTTPSSIHFQSVENNLFAGSGEPNNANVLVSTLNANSVKIPVWAFAPTGTSNTLSWLNSNNDPSIIGGNIDLMVNAYTSVGLKVILTLQFFVADGTFLQFFHPTSPVQFLTNLQSMAVQLAVAAQRKSCPAISITPGLFPSASASDLPTNYMAQWVALYRACKNAYTGEVLYFASAANVGPVGSPTAMDWTSCWDQIGVIINPPYGTNVTAANIQNYWTTTNDTEAAYGKPLFGTSGWLRTLYNAWSGSGRKLFVEIGVSITGAATWTRPKPVVPGIALPTPTVPAPTRPTVPTVPVPTGTGNFVTQNGKIYDPDGRLYIAAGLNVGDPTLGSQYLALFPNVNFFRCAVGYDSVAAWTPFFNMMSARKIVCEIEHHPWPLVNALTGSALTTENNWYAGFAAAFKNNPYVWFGTLNEPQGGDISAQHLATYNAIRNTGNNSMILLVGGLGGGNPGSTGAGYLTASTYLTMYNIAWDIHYYGWATNFTTDIATVQAALLGTATNSTGIRSCQAIRNNYGVIPVVIAEFGASTSGSQLDANWVQDTDAVMTWAALTNQYTSGFAGWHWNADPYNAVQNNGALTTWGQHLAAGQLAVKNYLATQNPISAPTVPTPAPSPRPALLKVMPLGDSFTAGGGTAVNGGPPPGSYRAPLYTALVADGFTVQYVGDQTVNPGGGLPTGQINHEGLAGYGVITIQNSQVNPGLLDYIQNNNILTRYTPDVVLLMIGYNNLYSAAPANIGPASTYSAIQAMVTYITGQLPNCKVIVAGEVGAPGQAGNDAATQMGQLNNLLKAGIASISSNVSYCDAPASFKYDGTDTGPDGVHPNTAGCAAIATAFAASIHTIYGAISTPAPTGIITPSSGGSVTDAQRNIWTLDAQGNLIENGAAVIGGAGTSGLTVVNGVIWAQDANSGIWYTYDSATGLFTQQAGTPVPPTPTPSPSIPSPPVTPPVAPPGSASMSRVVAPLTGTVTQGTWLSKDITVPGVTLPSGKQVHFNYLMPAQYNPSVLYPVMVWLHPDFDQSWYSGGDGMKLTQVDAGQWYNTTNFRQNYPCICVLAYADQTSGNDAIDNWGGWVNDGSIGSGTHASGDTGPNVFATIGVVNWILSNFSGDPSRVYVAGFSLGGIGAEYLMLKYNQVNGNPKVFTSGMSTGGVMEIHGYGAGPSASDVTTMQNVPVWWVSGANDGTSPPSGWNQPMWQSLSGNSNYPAPYGTTAQAQAGSSAYHFWFDPSIGHSQTDASGNPYPINGQILNYMFSQIGNVAIPGAIPATVQPTVPSIPTPTPTPPTPTPTPTTPTPTPTVPTIPTPPPTVPVTAFTAASAATAVRPGTVQVTTSSATWNAADKTSNITLSNNNLTATSATTTAQAVRVNSYRSSGKWYFEVTMNTPTPDWGIGLATSSYDLTYGPQIGGEGQTASWGFYPALGAPQSLFINGIDVTAGNGTAADAAGAVISVAVDISNKLLWVSSPVMRASGNNWNNSNSANPSTGSGGVSFSAVDNGPYAIIFADDDGGARCTLNTIGSFTVSIPTGFAPWR